MAKAAAHKFGQALGEYCEAAIEPLLAAFAENQGLYLDKTGPRPARKGKKLRWIDKYHSAHDLDYVLERGGSPEKVGTPVAFIETAWRRYTKHSKNKAQEIQGAILPIAERHEFSAPFLGCVLVGEYTTNAIDQLKNIGFHVLYFQYDTILEAFKRVGVDVGYDEDTPDHVITEKHRQWDAVPIARKPLVWETLLELNAAAVQEFTAALERTVSRQITLVRVIPLHGGRNEFLSVPDAIRFVVGYDESGAVGSLVKYEVQVRYNNGDRIDAEFQAKGMAVDFLKAYLSGNWTPSDEGLDEVIDSEDGADEETE